jgi:uncharacterized membrane protein
MSLEDKLKYITFSIYGLGVIVDHVTTVIGIKYFGLIESNKITGYLIENGVWAYIDITLCIFFVMIINFLCAKHGHDEFKFILCFPLLSGFIRIFAGMWNIFLII